MKLLPIVAVFSMVAGAASAQNKAEGEALFNGKDLSNWQDRNGKPTKWEIVDGAISGRKGSGDIWTKNRYGNFVLSLEFKTTGNSGVFFRTDNPKNCVQTGIEIQVERPGGPNKHSVGAIYDLVAPSKNAGKKDDWNKLVITANKNLINVNLNGEDIAEMDLDRWTEPNRNPDGSKNKFKTALKDFKREGHIGFQDHGHGVAYRKVTIKALK